MSRPAKPRLEAPRPLAAALLVASLLGALGGGAAGCCGHPCYGEDDLPRTAALQSPFDTVDFARFGIRHELWDPLYRAFTARTHKDAFEDEVGEEAPLLFGFVFPDLTYGDLMEALGHRPPPEVASIKIIDVLRDAEIVHIGYAPATPWIGAPVDRQAYAILRYHPITDLRWTTILLLDAGTVEEPRWEVALVETMDWLRDQGL